MLGLLICFNFQAHYSNQVQLQLLTAIVKLFLKKPTETQELVQSVLSLATQVRFAHHMISSFIFAIALDRSM